MKISTHFDVPTQIATGLLKGDMIRRGGVVQWADNMPNAGRVVGWLREATPEPSSPAKLGSLLGKAGSMLSLVGNVASIINVGATVGFGVVTLRKLGKMDGKLDHLVAAQERVEGNTKELLAGQERVEGNTKELLAGQERLEAGQQQLGAMVDIGFRLMFTGFENLAEGQARIEGQIDQKFHEQVLDKLSSASRDMETLSSLSLADPHRAPRVEHVLARTSEAFEALLRDAKTRSKALVGSFGSQTSGRAKLALGDEDVLAMQRIRMLASAAGQRARVLAEAGQPAEAARFLSQAAKQVRDEMLCPVGEACFRGETVYDNLLHHFWPTVGITAGRIGMWASRFDPATGSLEGVIQKLQEMGSKAEPFENTRPPLDSLGLTHATTSSQVRYLVSQPMPSSQKGTLNFTPAIVKLIMEASMSGLTQVDARIQWSEEEVKYVPAFFDLLDGAWEDLDRLEGHAAEYAEMSRRGLRIAEYGQRLRVDNVPEGVRLVFMTDDEELLDEKDEDVSAARQRVRVSK